MSSRSRGRNTVGWSITASGELFCRVFEKECWLTTHLRRAGMGREFTQEFRGDSRKEAIDIYDYIDLKELKEAYLASIPLFRCLK